jgi:hypothetical protein
LIHSSIRFTHVVKPVGINLHIVRGARRQRGQQHGSKQKGSELHLSKIDQTRAEGLSLLCTMVGTKKEISGVTGFSGSSIGLACAKRGMLKTAAANPETENPILRK